MEASQHWTRAINAVHFLNDVQERGGRQDQDPSYNPNTRKPRPARPPHATPADQPQQYDQPQPYGEASSYFSGDIQTPFPPAQRMQHQHSSPPATQGYSPPLASYDASSQQSHSPLNGGSYGYQQPNQGSTYMTSGSCDPQYTSYGGSTHSTASAPAQFDTPQLSTAHSMYDSSQALLQRSFTVPATVPDHDCNQHWNHVLGKCLICHPLQNAPNTWATGNS